MINLLLQVFIIAMLLPITLYHTQGNFKEVSVTVEPKTKIFQREDPTPVSFVCEYNAAPALTFNKLEWSHNGTKIKKYFENSGENNTEGNYEYSINKTHSVLRLLAVNSARDSLGNYTCLVQFFNKSIKESSKDFATGLLTEQVLLTYSLFHLSDDDKKNLLANGADVTVYRGRRHIFFFEVIGIMPKVTIECYLGEKRLETFERMTGDENKKNITSVFFIYTTESNSQQLECTAHTSDSKDPLPSVQVTIQYDVLAEMGISTVWILVEGAVLGSAVMFLVMCGICILCKIRWKRMPPKVEVKESKCYDLPFLN